MQIFSLRLGAASLQVVGIITWVKANPAISLDGETSTNPGKIPGIA